jgi:hypothetical protein
MVRLGITAAKILVPQDFSYTEDLADLLTHLTNWAEAQNHVRNWAPRRQRLRAGPVEKRSLAVLCVPCPALSAAAIDLIPMLFQDDTHQLTAHPHTGPDHLIVLFILRVLRTPAAPETRSFADCYRHPNRRPAGRSAEQLRK